MLAQGLFNLVAETAIVVLALVGLAVVIAMLLRMRRSLYRLRLAARRLALGDFSQQIEVDGPPQLAELAQALNQMAGQLQDRLATVVQQRNEFGAVLSSMAEGVLAIDTDEKILSLNQAAAQLLQLDPRHALGRPIEEAVRNSAMQSFVHQALQQSQGMQTELTLRDRQTEQRDQRHLELQSATLRDAAGQRIGAVIVIHDVTPLRRLEAVRRDFVANVSHELKTPVSTIKAAAETMLDDGSPEDGSLRFLHIIARQADRMAAIVDDLLSLARIEQETGRIRVELEPLPLAGLIHAACGNCQPRASQKQIQLEVNCPAELTARIDAPLLEQAVVNLVDNAVKYSPEGTTVRIDAEARDQEVVLAVRDQGRGIEPEHLPRIFERFYRTDTARSRALGGTGLGLSIVKHVAEAHGGRVSVDSALGQGSTFRIHLLPAQAAANPQSTDFSERSYPGT